MAKEFFQSSISSADTLVLFIKKKDSNLGLYVDYWRLNLITKKILYQLSLISEALNRVVKAKIYPKLNIKAAYNCI